MTTARERGRLRHLAVVGASVPVLLDSSEENMVLALALNAHHILGGAWNGWARPVATADGFADLVARWKINDPHGMWSRSPKVVERYGTSQAGRGSRPTVIGGDSRVTDPMPSQSWLLRRRSFRSPLSCVRWAWGNLEATSGFVLRAHGAHVGATTLAGGRRPHAVAAPYGVARRPRRSCSDPNLLGAPSPILGRCCGSMLSNRRSIAGTQG